MNNRERARARLQANLDTLRELRRDECRLLADVRERVAGLRALPPTEKVLTEIDSAERLAHKFLARFSQADQTVAAGMEALDVG